MKDLIEKTPWLMTAEALWDFVARDAETHKSAADIGPDLPHDDETPLFI